MSASQRIRGRIWRGLFGATLIYIAVSLGPFLLLPALIGKWGVEGYGQWVTAQALASFVSLGSLGLIPVCSSKISVSYAQNKIDELNVLVSTLFWSLLMASAASALVLIIFAFWGADYTNLTVSQQIVIPLIIYAATSQTSLFFLKILGSCGQYGKSDLINALFQIAELALVLLSLFIFSVGPKAVALIMLSINFISLIIIYVYIKASLPWAAVRFGFDRILFRNLVVPIGSALATTIGYSHLLVQGPRLLIGYTFGMTEVGLFNVMNVVIRMVRVPLDIINSGLRFEFSFAHGMKEFARLKSIFLLSNQISLCVSFPSVTFMIVFGKVIIGILSKHEININWPVFYVLLVSIIFECIPIPSFNYLVATNKQTSAGIALIFSSVLGFFVSWVLSSVTGLLGVAVAVAFATFVFGIVSIVTSLRAMQLAPLEYLKGITRIPTGAIFSEMRHIRDVLRFGKPAK